MSNLVEIVDAKINKVRTNNLDISFNELLDMYKDGELIISPEYQRLFRWDEVKQSRFIETLILELPLPPIFVIEIEEGKFELIDGLQRISSYLNFRGVLKEREGLKLIGCDIIPELNGSRYIDFPTTLKIKLKRRFIRVEVLRKESDNTLRYHMFKRLNSGGEILSEQEIRNSTIRLLNPKINNFIIEMSQNEAFQVTTSKITDKEIEKKFNEELVLRFFTLKNNLENFSYPFSEYLTKYMESVASNELDFNYKEEKKTFEKTFSILRNILDKDTFSTKLSTGKYQENFVLYYYDGLILGIQKYLIKIVELNNYDKLKSIFEEIKNNDKFFKARTGSKSNIKTRIRIVEEKLEEFFNEN
ncbi:hypothetical protein MNB_SV-12-925 [hydrothermal vent metagenome]|uniref:GmrSD restriction endonucleases N-terminal domain-containing protein n=1 Tax=hydrothermal vent metagenome TaxID=652676 RepID=A0A1W1C950_9ZZZZ